MSELTVAKQKRKARHDLAAVLTVSLAYFAAAPMAAQVPAPVSNKPTSGAETRKPFVSKEGRFSIVMPRGFVPFKENTFQSVSSWGDPMTVVQFFSYPGETPIGQTNNPPHYAMVMYFDYAESMTKLGFNSELLELVHKATLRKFPEYIILETKRAYWEPSTGKRTATERLDEAVYLKGLTKPVITSLAKTLDRSQLVRADSYLVGRRVYWTIAVYSPNIGFNKSAADAFFDSLRLNQ